MKIFICLLLSIFSFTATAGSVKLVNSDWPSICEVQVAGGMNAPNTSVDTYSNVSKGHVATRTDKLCYRRSANPSDCRSQMTAWTCDTRTISGSKQLQLR